MGIVLLFIAIGQKVLTGIFGREKNPLVPFSNSSLGIIPKGLGSVTGCEMNLSRCSQALSMSGAAIPVKVQYFCSGCTGSVSLNSLLWEGGRAEPF